jgi:hypothetical protein
MKFAGVLIVLFAAVPAYAQDIMSRIATLESNNAALLNRMAAVESKVDALAAKLDRAAPVSAVPQAPVSAAPVAYGTYYSSGAASCGAAACGQSGGRFYPLRNISSRLWGR